MRECCRFPSTGCSTGATLGAKRLPTEPNHFFPPCPQCPLWWRVRQMKYSVITFGCRVNQADSLGFEEELRRSGAECAPPQSADLIVVNTCSVTATSDQGARQTIRRVARDNPSARIVVTGCYATRRPDEVSELPNVARVIANDDKPRLLPLLRTLTAENAENAEQNVFSAFFASS